MPSELQAFDYVTVVHPIYLLEHMPNPMANTMTPDHRRSTADPREPDPSDQPSGEPPATPLSTPDTKPNNPFNPDLPPEEATPPPASPHSKPCALCSKPRDVLIRCQIDSSGKWHLICTGACWRRVSGGVVDGDGAAEHSFYRYGGMWKNKHEAVSARIKGKAGGRGKKE